MQGTQLSSELLIRVGQVTDCLLQMIGFIFMSRLQLLNDCLVMYHLALSGHHVRIALRQLSLILNGLLPKLCCGLTQAAINRLLEQFANPSLRLDARLRRLSQGDHLGDDLLKIEVGRP